MSRFTPTVLPEPVDYGAAIADGINAFVRARRQRQTDQDRQEERQFRREDRTNQAEDRQTNELLRAIELRKNGIVAGDHVEHTSRPAPVTGAVVRNLQGQEVPPVDARYTRLGEANGTTYYEDPNLTPEGQISRLGQALQDSGIPREEVQVLTSPAAATRPELVRTLLGRIQTASRENENRAVFERLTKAYPNRAGSFDSGTDYRQLERKYAEAEAMEQDLRHAGYSAADARARAWYGVDPQDRRIQAEREDRLSTSSQRAAYKPTAREQTDAKAYATQLLGKYGNDPDKALQALHGLGDLSDFEELVRAELVDLQAAKQRRVVTGAGAVPSWMR